MYRRFFKGNQEVVTAAITNGLYIFTHVSKKCQDTAFADLENTNRVDTEENTADNNEETSTLIEDKTKYNIPLSNKKKWRYLKYHQRFTYLNPKKISNLHKVITLTRPTQVSNKDDMDACEVFTISKIRNKISRGLSPRAKQTRQTNRKYQPTVEEEPIESTPVPNKALDQILH